MSNPSMKKVPASLNPQVWKSNSFSITPLSTEDGSIANTKKKKYPIDIIPLTTLSQIEQKKQLQSSPSYLWIEETTTIKGLEWQLTIKDWRNWGYSVRSSASPPFFVAEHSKTSKVQHNSFHSALPGHSHPALCCCHLLSLQRRSAPNPYSIAEAKPQPCMALLSSRSLLGKMPVIKHKLLSTGNAPQLTHTPPQSVTWPSRARNCHR